MNLNMFNFYYIVFYKSIPASFYVIISINIYKLSNLKWSTAVQGHLLSLDGCPVDVVKKIIIIIIIIKCQHGIYGEFFH